MKQAVEYSKGELDGKFESYHSNTNLRIQGQYLEGHEDGAWRTYLEDESMEMIVKYSYGKIVKEIRINGVFEDTFPDGRSKSEYSYKDKKLDGPYSVWHDCGEYVIEPFTDEETGEQLQQFCSFPHQSGISLTLRPFMQKKHEKNTFCVMYCR